MAAAVDGRIAWPRLAAEFITIVTGVLLALAVDAWWAQRVDRADERAALEVLLADFQSNSLRLDTIRAEDEQVIRAGYELLWASANPDPDVTADSMAVLLFEITDVWTYDPVLGGLSSLISSGQLNLIRSDSLRVALAAWPDIVENLQENERTEWNETSDRLIPHLEAGGYWAPVLAKHGRLSELPLAEAPAELLDILHDEYFINAVANRVYNVEWIFEEIETVDQGLTEIIRLVEAELRR